MAEAAPSDHHSVGLVTAESADFSGPFPLASGESLPAYTLVYECYGVLNASEQRASDLPCALRPSSRRGLLRFGRSQARLVGHGHWPGQGHRHQSLLRRRLDQSRGLPRQHRAHKLEPGHGTPLRAGLSHGDRSGLGERPSRPGRSPGYRALGSGGRGQPGRHAGAPMGPVLSRPGGLRGGHCQHATPFRPEHRL